MKCSHAYRFLAESEDFLVPVASIFSMQCKIFLYESKGEKEEWNYEEMEQYMKKSSWKSARVSRLGQT